MVGSLSFARAGLFVLLLGGLAQRPAEPRTDGLLLRIGGDVQVPAGAHYDAVIVFQGNANIAGSADFVLGAGGSVRLDGGRANHVIVANGELLLQGESEVTGDVELFRSGLTRSEGAVVRGRVRETALEHALKGAWFFGAFLALGVAFAILAAGLVTIAVARDGTQQVGRILLQRLPAALLATAVLWIGLPVLAVGLMPTIVAVPAGIGLFVFVLPALGFAGYVLAGIALGRAVLHSLRPGEGGQSHYWASTLGIGLLLIGGLLPIVGGIVAPVAGAVGSGALAVALWERAAALQANGVGELTPAL
ncbi:MAG: hypothetical protein ACR2QM_00760 [Longimicrobiales bacterium]